MTTSETLVQALISSGKYFQVGRNKSSWRCSGDVNYSGIKKAENDRTWFVIGSGSKRVNLIIHRADIQTAVSDQLGNGLDRQICKTVAKCLTPKY